MNIKEKKELLELRETNKIDFVISSQCPYKHAYTHE